MNQEDLISWLSNLKPQLIKFLDQLHVNNGFYNFSLSGDIIPSNIKWGLGNAVFASRIYYLLDALNKTKKKQLISFIKSFQDEKGYIFDPVIQKRSKIRRYYHSLRYIDFPNVFNEQTRRAETRQSFAALDSLGSRPDIPFLNLPYNPKKIKKYIDRLNWGIPWGACSHISHLVFFIKINNRLFSVHQENADELIHFVLDYVNQEYRQTDGSWYATSSEIPKFQKINAAMKMMTTFQSAEIEDFDKKKELIDLCLSTVNEGHACNHFNVVCVLYHCSLRTDYKKKEIQNYYLKQLEYFKSYYFEEYGGFSFLKDRASPNYYKAVITKGLNEPDIHGTFMFLWGIALITKILKYHDIIKLNIPIT